MVYKKKTVVKKGVTKKKLAQNLSKAQVARIARQVTLKTAETKSYIANIADSVTDNVYRVVCLNYGMVEGNTAETRVGEKVFIKNVRIKGTALNTSGGGASMLQRIGRITVFMAKKNLATSSPSTLTTRSDVFRGTAYIHSDHVDLHKVTLLYDNTFLFPLQNATDQYTNKLIDINVPINRTKFFDSDTQTYFKDMDIYVAYGIYTNGGITTPGQFIFNYAVNWKDE